MKNLRVLYNGLKNSRDVAQSGSVPEWGSGGREFKSRRPDFLFRRSDHKRVWEKGFFPRGLGKKGIRGEKGFPHEVKKLCRHSQFLHPGSEFKSRRPDFCFKRNNPFEKFFLGNFYGICSFA